MEIRDNKKIQIDWYAETANREKRMSKKESDSRKRDAVEIQTKIPANMNQSPEVRRDKIEKARENIAAGRYQKPDVLGEIVNRLIDQFGL